MVRTTTEILAQLATAGIYPFVISLDPHGGEDEILRGYCDLAVLAQLRADPRCDEGEWHHLHAQSVGTPRTEFRFHRGELGPGSLQFVVNTVSGRFDADVDQFNTQDVVNIFGHLFGEVIGPKIAGWFTRKKKTEHV